MESPKAYKILAKVNNHLLSTFPKRRIVENTMKAVFLDFATVDVNDLDPSPLTDVLPDLTFFDVTPTELVTKRIQDAEFVFTNKIRLDEAILSTAKSLRFIGVTATGTDNIDLSSADKYGIAVYNIRAYCTQSVVEYVFGTLLYFTHNIGRFVRTVKLGEWQNSNNFCMLKYPIRELSSMTLGLVGHGELGRGVEKIAQEFGMTVLIARRPGSSVKHDDGRTDFGQLGLTYQELEDAMNNPTSTHRSKYLEKRKLNLHKMEPIPVCKIPK